MVFLLLKGVVSWGLRPTLTKGVQFIPWQGERQPHEMIYGVKEIEGGCLMGLTPHARQEAIFFNTQKSTPGEHQVHPGCFSHPRRGGM